MGVHLEQYLNDRKATHIQTEALNLTKEHFSIFIKKSARSQPYM